MLPEIGIGLAVGLSLGLVIAWVLGQSHRQRAAQLEQQLAERAAALESAQRERDAARLEAAAQQQAAAERDAGQREEIARIATQRGSFEKDAEKAANALEEQRAEITRLRTQLLDSETERASLKTALDAEQKSHSEKLAALTDQFKALAGDILKENSRVFTEQNQANIGHLLNPLKEKFGEFQKEVENLKESGITGRTELKEQIKNLTELNTQLSDDAKNLTTALKGSSKTQGNWGELVLERILESSGLRKNHEYRVQESFTREDGSRAQPDVILYLPEARHIVIDSKVSLNGYDEFCAAADDPLRNAALARHLTSVRNHIRELSQKNYQALYQLNSLDFVVMFVCIEPAFMLALSSDSKLWQEAWEKNVLLVSPSTVLYVLRTVAQLWRQEQQTKSVQEIVRRGGELYDKLAAFANDLTEVGKNLDKARSSYDDAVKKLSTGKGNAIRQAELLKSLGVKPSKAIPLVLVERNAEDEEAERLPLSLAASMEETEA